MKDTTKNVTKSLMTKNPSLGNLVMENSDKEENSGSKGGKGDGTGLE